MKVKVDYCTASLLPSAAASQHLFENTIVPVSSGCGRRKRSLNHTAVECKAASLRLILSWMLSSNCSRRSGLCGDCNDLIRSNPTSCRLRRFRKMYQRTLVLSWRLLRLCGVSDRTALNTVGSARDSVNKLIQLYLESLQTQCRRAKLPTPV